MDTNSTENNSQNMNEANTGSTTTSNGNEENIKTADIRNENVSNYYVYNKSKNVIYYLLGLIEVLLIFRLLFKSLGANTNNSLVSALYGVTNLFIAPFVGIFNIITANNAIKFIIEPATIIAMIVYALIAYGIIKLVKVSVIHHYD